MVRPFPPHSHTTAVPEAKPFADAIDGTDGVSWRLPLEPLSATSLEAHSPGEQPEIDRLQARMQRLHGQGTSQAQQQRRCCGLRRRQSEPGC